MALPVQLLVRLARATVDGIVPVLTLRFSVPRPFRPNLFNTSALKEAGEGPAVITQFVIFWSSSKPVDSLLAGCLERQLKRAIDLQLTLDVVASRSKGGFNRGVQPPR